MSDSLQIHVGCMRFLLEVVGSVLRVLKALSVESVWNAAEYRRLERMSKSPLNVGGAAVFIVNSHAGS